MKEVERFRAQVHGNAPDGVWKVRLPRGAQDHAGAVAVLVGADEIERHAIAVRDAPRRMAEMVFALVGPAALSVACHLVAVGAVRDGAEVKTPHARRVDGKRLRSGLRRMLREPAGNAGEHIGVGLQCE